jgi:hypothetical protein
MQLFGIIDPVPTVQQNVVATKGRIFTCVSYFINIVVQG